MTQFMEQKFFFEIYGYKGKLQGLEWKNNKLLQNNLQIKDSYYPRYDSISFYKTVYLSNGQFQKQEFYKAILTNENQSLDKGIHDSYIRIPITENEYLKSLRKYSCK